jgi:hypothetical protein
VFWVLPQSAVCAFGVGQDIYPQGLIRRCAKALHNICVIEQMKAWW